MMFNAAGSGRPPDPSRRTVRVRLVRTTAVLTAILATACSAAPGSAEHPPPSSSATAPGSTTSSNPAPTPGGRPLPPSDSDAIAQVLDPELAVVDFRVSHASLIDDRDGRYDGSATGNHLAVYVTPSDPKAVVPDYDATLVTTLQAIGPGIFERWPGLTSFDICQEKPGRDVNSSGETITQVKIPRAAVVDIDLGTVDLAGLRELSAQGSGVTLDLDPAT